ncbi:MAG TPA: O-antigen ligase family protein [Chloroflexota bacterium]
MSVQQIQHDSAKSALRSEAAATALAAGGAALLIVSQSSAPALAAIALLVIAFAVRPASGLLLVAVTLPFYLFQKGFGAMSFSLPELFLLTTLLGAAIRFAWTARSSTIGLSEAATPLDLPIALFIAAALISLLASEVLRVSLRDLRTLILEPIAAYYLGVWLLGRRHLPWLVGALVAGGVAAALTGLYQYAFTAYTVDVEGARRMLGPYLSPNQLGLYLGRSLPFVLAAAIFAPRSRAVAIPGLAVLGAAQILTFSVGAWIATLLALGTVVALWRPRALLVAAGMVAAASVAAVPVLSSERLASHLSLTRGTSFIRLQLWESSLRMIADHPVLGVGMDNFLYQYRSLYMLPEAAAEPNLSHPHNLVLNFWLEVGILGLLAFLWILASLARSWAALWRASSSPTERTILAGIAGAAADFVSHGMVDNSYFLTDMAFHFWLLAATIGVLSRSLHGDRRIG